MLDTTAPRRGAAPAPAPASNQGYVDNVTGGDPLSTSPGNFGSGGDPLSTTAAFSPVPYTGLQEPNNFSPNVDGSSPGMQDPYNLSLNVDGSSPPPQMSAADRFVEEQERIDAQERQDRRLLQSDGISLAGAFKVTKLTVGPDLEQTMGADRTLDEIEQMKKQAQAPVTLHVYAVGHAEAVAKINAVAQDILGEGGVFHGAIEIYDKEWSFGGTDEDVPGVFCNEPGKCSMHTYRESVYLGDCKKKPEEIEKIIKKMLPDWNGQSYDLLHKNCCSFSDAFAVELGVGHIPEWVHHLAHLGAKLDDESKAAIEALHTIENTVIQDVNYTLNVLSMKKPQGGQSSKGRHCRCCWYEF